MLQTDVEKILQRTNGGLTVFTHYLGEACLGKRFCNPFRDDKHPSCRLYENKNSHGIVSYYMNDFARKEYSGDCFWMVSMQLGLDLCSNFKTILETIDHDLCLGVFDSTPNAKKTNADYTARMVHKFTKTQESSIKDFSLTKRAFTQYDQEYWGKYGINAEVLERYGVCSVKSCTFTKVSGKSFTVFSSSEIPMFAYEFGEGEGYKFYRPGASSRFLYAGKLPRPYVFGWEQLPPSAEKVFITGGEKDVLSLASHGFPAIAFNSETAKVPEDTIKELASRFNHVVFLYDSDETGKAESSRECERFSYLGNVTRLVLPLAGTKKEKDISDFFAMGNTCGIFNDWLCQALD